MLLRKDDPWIEELPIPDVRDWRVVDADGKSVGFVQSVVVDKPDNVFEAVLTGANDRFSAEEIDVDGGVVRVTRSLKRREVPRERRDRQFLSFGDAYRDHFERAFRDQDVSFEAAREAYTFGRVIRLDADFAGRTFEHAEEDVRGTYAVRRPKLPYEVVRQAVRFGYELAQSLDRHEEGGMERERQQIMGPDEHSAGASVRTGHSMHTGRPIAEDKSALDGS